MQYSKGRGEVRLRANQLGHPNCQEKPLARWKVIVLQTDTGRLVENTKALERTLLKELGKITP
jgi:hypothetical protein